MMPESLSRRLLVGLLVALAAAAAAAERIVVFPTQDRAGDSRATAAVEAALRRELAGLGDLLDGAQARSALRALRIRRGDDAPPEVLRRLGGEVGAAFLFSATVHDGERRGVPRLAVSARAYDGSTGELVWAGFEAASGLDGRGLLGLGVIDELEDLAPVVVGRLVGGLDPTGSEAPPRRSADAVAAASRLGTVAVLPFIGFTERRAIAAGETVTEVARAAGHRRGIRMVSPNRTLEVLRRERVARWGAIPPRLRLALQAACGADKVLTGTVEIYDVGGAELEPEPRVAVSMQLSDAATGRLLWAGGLERRGWDRPGLFRLRRVYSRGQLAAQMIDRLMDQLLSHDQGSRRAARG